MNKNPEPFYRLFQKIEEMFVFAPVGENRASFDPATRYVIPSVGYIDAQRPCHATIVLSQ